MTETAKVETIPEQPPVMQMHAHQCVGCKTIWVHANNSEPMAHLCPKCGLGQWEKMQVGRVYPAQGHGYPPQQGQGPIIRQSGFNLADSLQAIFWAIAIGCITLELWKRIKQIES